MNISGFYDLVSTEKLQKIVSSDPNFQLISKLDLLSLQKILYQYRFIVQDHAKHLEIIVSRLPSGEIKELLEEIYLEEIGNHDFQKSHFYLYNSFLKSLGCTDFSCSVFSHLSYNLVQYDKAIQNNSISYAVGLGGMGTECICQFYLTELNRQLRANPAIRKIQDHVDWEFMDLHVGDVDISHRIRIRKTIIQFLVDQGGNSLYEISEGYKFSLSFWSQLFSILSQNLSVKVS
ncbi:MAG: iron-containing redox enzyme family protein [Crocosphaera sp.]|nr:iron-containing redox enzyme family protein [Crocosphaera sp.]